MSDAVHWPGLPQLRCPLRGLTAGTTQRIGNAAAAGGCAQPGGEGHGPGEPGARPQQVCTPVDPRTEQRPAAGPDRRQARALSCGVSKLCPRVPSQASVEGVLAPPLGLALLALAPSSGLKSLRQEPVFSSDNLKAVGRRPGRARVRVPDASPAGKGVRGRAGIGSQAGQAAHLCRCLVRGRCPESSSTGLRTGLPRQSRSWRPVFGECQLLRLSLRLVMLCQQQPRARLAAQATLPVSSRQHPDDVAREAWVHRPHGPSWCQLAQPTGTLQSRPVSGLTSEEVGLLSLIPASCQLQGTLGLSRGP